MSSPEFRRTPRVLFCLNGPNQLGGPNVWLTRHVPRLRARGIDAGLLYCTRRPGEACRYRDELTAQGIRVREVVFKSYLEDRVLALCAAMDAERPDAVVANCTTEMYFAGRFAREAGIITIGILHNDSDKYYDIVDAFITGEPEWRLSGVVAVSDFLSRWLALRCPATVAQLCAPCGTPLPGTTSRPPAGRLRLLYVGRLFEVQKRILRLTSRLIAAARVLPEVDAVLYGDGPERNRIDELVVASGLSERVRRGGVINADASVAAMLESQAFVLLSDFEGFSVALLEAMACGLVPIVANTRSGASEILRDNENALVVDPDDEEAFVEAVRRLRDEPGLWQRVSTGARQSVIDLGLTSDECARRWADFLRVLCRRRPQPGAVVVPPPRVWKLPPESARPDGICHDDKRSPAQRVGALARSRRPVLLWGAGGSGRAFLAEIRDVGLRIEGFVDSDPAKEGNTIEGLRIAGPSALRRCDDEERPFVFVTSMYRAQIFPQLEAMGYRAGADFVQA